MGSRFVLVSEPTEFVGKLGAELKKKNGLNTIPRFLWGVLVFREVQKTRLARGGK